MTKEGERRGLAELMANLEEWHPARRDYEAMKELLEERYPAPSPEALEALRAGIESARTEPLVTSDEDFARYADDGPDRERIEFIRRAYLARIAALGGREGDEHLNTFDEHGVPFTYSGRHAVWRLAMLDWEAKPDGV